MKEERSLSIEEPPVKKKKITEEECSAKASSSSEEIEMKPGPSFSGEERDTTTVTEVSDNSSNISSDDFTSADSSPEPSPRGKNPTKTSKMKKTTLSVNTLTTAFRKTCENLKNLIDKRRKVSVNSPKEVTPSPPTSEV